MEKNSGESSDFRIGGTKPSVANSTPTPTRVRERAGSVNVGRWPTHSGRRHQKMRKSFAVDRRHLLILSFYCFIGKKMRRNLLKLSNFLLKTVCSEIRQFRSGGFFNSNRLRAFYCFFHESWEWAGFKPRSLTLQPLALILAIWFYMISLKTQRERETLTGCPPGFK